MGLLDVQGPGDNVDPSLLAGLPVQQDTTSQPSGGGFLDGLLNRLSGGVPSGYQGLLSPGDVRQSQRMGLLGAGASLLQNSGPRDPWHPAATTGVALGDALQQFVGGTQQRQQQILGSKMQAMQIAQSLRGLRAQQTAQALFPLTPGMTREEQQARLANIGAYYAANGLDPKGMSELAAAMKPDYGYGGRRVVVQLKNGQTGIMDKDTGIVTKSDGTPLSPSEENRQTPQQIAQLAEEARKNTLTDKEQLARIQAMEDVHQDNIAVGQGKQFESRMAPFRQMEQKYRVASTALDQAQAKNPVAYKSALLDAFAAMDPSAQMRQGVINMSQTPMVSLLGKAQMYKDKLLTGDVSPEALQGLRQSLDAMHTSMRYQYEHEYQSQLKRNPLTAKYMTPGSDIYESGAPAAAATPAAPASAPAATTAVNPFR